MDSLQALILGIVQGITEFLPISSSAHLILGSKLLGLPDQGLNFDLAVHFGSLLAVIIYFKQQAYLMVKGKVDFIRRRNTKEAELFKKIFVSIIPILFFGLLMKELVETTFRDALWIIGTTSIVWGILLYFADKQPENIKSINSISYKAAFLMGIAQALAIIPGTSRSGSTMTVARFLKFSRTSAAEFSMLMSIPVIILMTIFNLYEIYINNTVNTISYQFLAIGTISSFIFAIISIHFLMKFVSKIGFIPFVVYRILLGCIIFMLIV